MLMTALFTQGCQGQRQELSEDDQQGKITGKIKI